MSVAQPYHLFTYRIDRTCIWDDQNCHALWVAQRNLQVNGYLRRSCNTPRSGKFSRNHAQFETKKIKLFLIFSIPPQHTLHLNILFASSNSPTKQLSLTLIFTSGTNVPNSARRSDGYYTVGMQDINFQVPDNRIIGCAAKCGDTQYPDPQPGSDPVEIIHPL